MKNKPLLILDFDGVINPMNFQKEWIGETAPSQIDLIYKQGSNWRLFREEIDTEYFFGNDNTAEVQDTATSRTYNIQWGSQLIAAINELIEVENLRPVMLTTWKDDSVNILNPLMGLNIHEFIPPTSTSGDRYYVSDYDKYQTGKTIALQEWLKSEYGEGAVPPIVWFDDVATYYFAYYSPEYDPNDFFGTQHFKAFLTRASKGISRKELNDASDFLRSLQV